MHDPIGVLTYFCVSVRYHACYLGNLHLNVSTPSYTEEMEKKLEPFVFEWTAQRGGSISAEHGIGTLKPHDLHLAKSPAAIKVMKEIKAMLDPQGTLNPFRVLPTEQHSTCVRYAPPSRKSA
eukprot:Rmarinus@m.140